jgi:hypothetical protein
MKELENVFFEAIKSLSGIEKGYKLKFVYKSFDSTTENEPPDILKLDYSISSSKVTLRFTLSASPEALLNVCFNNESDGFFYLSEYLTFHKMLAIKSQLFSCRRDITASLHLIFELFNNELNDIIIGKKWEDIPRDWMGYK